MIEGLMPLFASYWM